MKRSNYLRRQREATFNIKSGETQPKHAFVYHERKVRSSNQGHNPHIRDTFKVNTDNNDCYLSAARLEVGNYYPDFEYSESDKVRIYTFKVHADNNDCYLSASRLEFGNGVQNLNTRKVISWEYIEMLSTISINKMTRIQDHY